MTDVVIHFTGHAGLYKLKSPLIYEYLSTEYLNTQPEKSRYIKNSVISSLNNGHVLAIPL
jgi:hypothetical protein